MRAMGAGAAAGPRAGAGAGGARSQILKVLFIVTLLFNVLGH
jgi:hypothetical protein